MTTLAIRILSQAAKDWERYKEPTANPTDYYQRGDYWARQSGFPGMRDALIAFFHSEWCRRLFEALGIDHRWALKRLEVPTL